MRRSAKAMIFCSGIFFGGAVDHAILALKRSDRTPYGIRTGVGGNWLMAALDAALAAAAYQLHRRLDVADDESRLKPLAALGKLRGLSRLPAMRRGLPHASLVAAVCALVVPVTAPAVSGSRCQIDGPVKRTTARMFVLHVLPAEKIYTQAEAAKAKPKEGEVILRGSLPRAARTPTSTQTHVSVHVLDRRTGRAVWEPRSACASPRAAVARKLVRSRSR